MVIEITLLSLNSKNDDPEKNWTCSSYNFELAVFVSEEDYNRKAANNDTLENQKDGPEDHVETDNAG